MEAARRSDAAVVLRTAKESADASRAVKKLSPTQRSLAYMRETGYFAEVTEHWNPHARIRQDLFGFIDIVCVPIGTPRHIGKSLVMVQSTSVDNIASRVAKICEPWIIPKPPRPSAKYPDRPLPPPRAPKPSVLPHLINASVAVEVHGWRPDGRLRVIDIHVLQCPMPDHMNCIRCAGSGWVAYGEEGSPRVWGDRLSPDDAFKVLSETFSGEEGEGPF